MYLNTNLIFTHFQKISMKWKKSKLYVKDRTHSHFYNFEYNNLALLMCLTKHWKLYLEPGNVCETPLGIYGTSSEM